MPNFLLLATAWGPKFGGINAFNMDFAKGLASFLGERGTVFCGVLDASDEDIADAKTKANVTLISIKKDPNTPRFDTSWPLEFKEILDLSYPDEKIDYWIGHDVVSSAAAKRGAKLNSDAKSATIMHMNYEAYQSYKNRVGQLAREKFLEQKGAFLNAAYFFANGPLLTAALRDMVQNEVTQLIPGFAEIVSNPTKAELTFITFGRMDRENDRIKQGSLAAAGFGLAIEYAHSNPATPNKLRDSPRLNIIGINEPGGEDEVALRKLASGKANRAVVVNPQKYDENRDILYEQIGKSNIAMMLSWHEGFGLTAWEAIAAQVPLIVSKNSGVWRLLAELLGEKRAATYVKLVDVRGNEGTDESDNFAQEDAISVRDAILEIAHDLGKAQKDATELRAKLEKKIGCTWERTAEDFCKGLGLSIKKIDITDPKMESLEAPSKQPFEQLTSTQLSIPKSSWPKDRSIPMPDSFMLRPEAGIVRFHSFRIPLRDQIVEWVIVDDQPIKLRLHSGVGGAGKTRLMIEVCKVLEADHGWQVGFLPTGKDIGTEISTLLSKARPTVLVLDYAETRSKEIIQIIQSVLSHKQTVPFRLLLLSRSGGDW